MNNLVSLYRCQQLVLSLLILAILVSTDVCYFCIFLMENATSWAYWLFVYHL